LSIRLWGAEVRGLEVVKSKNVFSRVTTPRSRQHSCSVFGSPLFESRPGHRLTWVRLFMVFLSPSSTHQSSPSKHTTQFPSSSLPSNYSLNTLSCADRATGSVVKNNRHIYIYRVLEFSEDLAVSN
jgi:hypothetical protein